MAGARKITMVRNCGSVQHVRVVDGEHPNEIILSLSECSYPAGLTPVQARFVAKCLMEAADRCEANINDRTSK